MEKATITCQYINPPKSEKGPGNVKDTNGNYWKCWKETLPLFEVGRSYDITYEAGSYKGKPDNTVLTVKPSAKAPEVAQPKAQQAPYMAPKYGAVDLATSKRIYTCGLLNGWAESGNLVIDHKAILFAINEAEIAWNNSSLSGNKQVDQEMNDEIPYK